MHRNIPVFGGEYLVKVDEQGCIRKVSGRYYNADIKCAVSPVLDKNDAVQRVAVAFEKTFKQSTTELYVYPLKGRFYLAWQIRFTDPATHTCWQYRVDAETGAVLSKQDISMRATGQGNIYESFPEYNGLSLPTESVTLPRLDGTGYVRGIYADVDNTMANRINDGNFNRYPNYEESCHFDEVNVYYHIDQFRANFINPLLSSGNFSLSFTQIQARVGIKAADTSGRAAYIDQSGVMCFSHTTSENLFDLPNYAHEAQIIYHEYTHAVVTDLGIDYSASFESTALHEAVADYFAGAYIAQKNEPLDNAFVIGEYAFSNNQRNMVSPVINDYQSCQGATPHAAGEFFSHILLSLRSNLGDQSCNTVVFKALGGVPSNVEFPGYRDEMMDVSSSADAVVIQNKFADHGIGDYANQPPGPPQNLGITGQIGGHPSLSWTAPDEPDLSYYRVYRKRLSDPDFVYMGLTSGLSITDWDITISGNFMSDHVRYFVKAVDEEGLLSAPSGEVRAYEVWMNPGLKQIENNNVLAAQNEVLPEKMHLHPAYPNPFNPTTQLRFDLPQPSHVTLTVYALSGRQVSQLIDRKMPAGSHSVRFDAAGLASGIYIARLVSGSTSYTRRLVLMK